MKIKIKIKDKEPDADDAPKKVMKKAAHLMTKASKHMPKR